MSLQGEIADSGSLKSKSSVRSFFVRLFSFERNGGVKDRLLTALIVLAGALALSLVAVYAPYGRLLAVGWASAVVFTAVFEVVRLFGRDVDTLRYRPVAAVLAYVILSLPAVGATVAGAAHVLGYGLDLSLLYVLVVLSGISLTVMQVAEGHAQIEVASRFAERYGTSYRLRSICAPQLIIISSLPRGVQLLWWIVAVVALNDASAYFAGRFFGKHKMAPALSPNKTIEGMCAGLVAGVLGGVVFYKLLLAGEMSTFAVVVVSFWATVAAQAADLSKSYLKRLRGVKDTGALFPGHGGVLDRFDGMIGASPVVAAALLLLGLM